MLGARKGWCTDLKILSTMYMKYPYSKGNDISCCIPDLYSAMNNHLKGLHQPFGL